ncbi:MAG: hypothetical protein F6J93_07420 [Oscillatoria sp. SIO1A7]|nr:hypothetical protein [Oscillatoria sp. SIO1A7]
MANRRRSRGGASPSIFDRFAFVAWQMEGDREAALHQEKIAYLPKLVAWQIGGDRKAARHHQ